MSQVAQPPVATPAGPPVDFTVAPGLSPFQVSARAYLDAHPGSDGLGVGAFVLNDGRLLLVQRAAHDSMPGRWEVPGGSCDFEDETLLHGMARELWEESQLRAKRVLCQVGGEAVFFSRRQKRISKLSFLVEVEGYDVQLDPNEHQAYLWVTEEEARAKRCGDVEIMYTMPQQERLVYEAFGIWKALKQG